MEYKITEEKKEDTKGTAREVFRFVTEKGNSGIVLAEHPNDAVEKVRLFYKGKVDVYGIAIRPIVWEELYDPAHPDVCEFKGGLKYE